MKNYCSKILFFIFASELFFSSYVANPGDTTWVTVWKGKSLTHYGNYDTTATFPTGKRFRKIRLHYELGRYACPPTTVTPAYCGSWDYTTQIFTRHANMDSVEIARVITPYATDWLSKGIRHDYIVDVTDYATSLDGITAMRFNYSGYSWGFTITLRLEFIEGIPPMDALKVKNIYNGYFGYGSATNSIENYLTAKTYSYGTNAGFNMIKNTVSGHGSDVNGCSEFCSKYYQLYVNGNLVSQKQLWRKDCGMNQVYPQTGTWIYQRGNWCPGAIVWPIYHNISSITSPNTQFTVDVNMQPYTTATVNAGYNWVSQLINYSTPNFSTDVAIENIITPTIDSNFVRNNPSCSQPRILVRNVGTNSVYSISFNYGISGSTIVPMSYTWTGNLNFLDTTTVFLPPSISIMTVSSGNMFTVGIKSVNNAIDQYSLNNIYASKNVSASIMPDTFIVRLFTNKSTSSYTGFNQTTWSLYDDSGTLLYTRDSCANLKAYLDTLILMPGCYKFSLDDDGCDGLYFWNNTAGGTGTCRFENYAVSALYNFPQDIGCNFVKQFIIPDKKVNTTSLIPKNKNENSVTIFPNPAAQEAYIKFDLNAIQNVEYKILDITGKIVSEKTINNIIASYEKIETKEFSPGVYFISVKLADGNVLTRKIIVQ